jgi:hypothetical protein
MPNDVSEPPAFNGKSYLSQIEDGPHDQQALRLRKSYLSQLAFFGISNFLFIPLKNEEDCAFFIPSGRASIF